MKTAQIWVKESFQLPCADGVSRAIFARGWSDSSIEDAKNKARERAQCCARRIGTNAQGHSQKEREYQYAAMPLAEPVLETVTDQNGACAALITRNGYGTRVLNTETVMFVDLDLPADPENRGFLASLFRGAPTREAREEPIVTKVKSYLARNSSLGARLYRTHSGMRLLITSKELPVRDSESQQLMHTLGADPLYLKLCRAQESYRARLTPKPWRCDCKSPPVQFPLISEEEKQQFREWEEEYETVIKDYATCELIGSFGSPHRNADIDELLKIHDRETGVGSGKPLA